MHATVIFAGTGGVSKAGVTAVVANVTAVLPTSPMYFTVYPGGSARPETANLNAAPGRPVPNLVVMGVSPDGYIEVFNSHGSTHCVVDVFGYATATGGERLHPVTPARLFDSRRGTGVRRGMFRPGEPVEIQVAGRARVPKSGASAVVINLTAVAPWGSRRRHRRRAQRRGDERVGRVTRDGVARWTVDARHREPEPAARPDHREPRRVPSRCRRCGVARQPDRRLRPDRRRARLLRRRVLRRGPGRIGGAGSSRP